MNEPTRFRTGLARLLLIVPPLLALGCSSSDRGRSGSPAASRRPPATAPHATTRPATAPAQAQAGWKSLFDGKTLNNWRTSDFGGQGEPRVENGTLVIPEGVGLSGVTWEGEPPFKMNYEISLEAQRVSGGDFFCGLTFPVGDTHASLVLGGWAGTVCGISSIDGEDAAHNETTTFQQFQKGRWYRVRLRVTANKLQAWLDDKQIVDVDTEGKKISIREDIAEAKPLGISTWQTTGAVRNVKWREVKKENEDRG
jgi:hypothetical protein